jgi:prepilin-type N-terminal cleavage/methylation domain-containing protein
MLKVDAAVYMSSRKGKSACRSRQPLGFSILEVMIVVAIIGTLMAIVVPVLSQAKRSAKNTVSISNMRQCYISLTLYCDDHGGYGSLPTYPEAINVLRNAPTWAPNDFWRKDTAEVLTEPMIGSYGYVRGVPSFSADEALTAYRSMINDNGYGSVLLVDVFYGSRVFPFRKVDQQPVFGPPLMGFGTPDVVLKLRENGSVKIWRVDSPPYLGFGWESLFFDL